jgi:hypothetical protein
MLKILVMRSLSRPLAAEEADADEDLDAPCLIDDAPAPELPTGRSRLLAMMCVPARFVPTDVIVLLGSYHNHLRAMRLVRHYDDPRQFVALIEMDSQVSACVNVEP